MRTRNGRRKVLFGTNYPMIFHEPALADLEALAPRRRVPYLSANALRLFEGGPRRLLCLGERERAGQRVWCPQRTMRSHLMGSARPLHPPGVAEVGRGQRPRLVLRQSGSGSERRDDMVLAQPRPPRRSASARAARLDDRSNRQRPRRRAVAPAQEDVRRPPRRTPRIDGTGRGQPVLRLAEARSASVAFVGDRPASTRMRDSSGRADAGQSFRGSSNRRRLLRYGGVAVTAALKSSVSCARSPSLGQ